MTDLLLKTKPRGPQERAVRMALAQTGTGLFMGMGLGKSKTAIDVLNNTSLRRCLILCPKAVIQVWPLQFSLHSAREYPMLTLNDGHTTDRKAERVREFGDGVIVVNYESACYGYKGAGGKHGPLTRALFDWQPEMVVADECHRAKSATSKTSKFCWDLGRQPFVRKRLGLTGTPFHHAPEDIFGQMRFINPDVFGVYITGFRRRWMFNPIQKLPNVWRFRPDMRPELERVVAQHSITGLTRDAVDLPPVQDVVVPLTLDTKARNIYESLKRDFIAELDAGIVTAANAAVKSGKLRQLTGGHVFGEDGHGGTVGMSVPTPKGDALETILDGLPGERVVVFSGFKADVALTVAACKATGHKCWLLNGERDELADWQTHGGVMAVNIQSGGVGIDLSSACYGVFINHGTSYGNYEQARARLDRPGQTRPVTYWHLLCEGTLDTVVYRAMRDKGNVVAAMMDSMKRMVAA